LLLLFLFFFFFVILFAVLVNFVTCEVRMLSWVVRSFEPSDLFVSLISSTCCLRTSIAIRKDHQRNQDRRSSFLQRVDTGIGVWHSGGRLGNQLFNLCPGTHVASVGPKRKMPTSGIGVKPWPLRPECPGSMAPQKRTCIIECPNENQNARGLVPCDWQSRDGSH
jgi:hypothetical protein